jgi:hypothetical protein
MKVEVELPDLPGNMEYVPTPMSAMWSSTSHCWGLREMKVEAEFAVVEKKPPYPAPEGYEFTGEYRVPKQGEVYLADKTFGDHWAGRAFPCGYTNKPYFMLRKKKPTYTEAVKATGWKWPGALHPKYEFMSWNEERHACWKVRPIFDGVEWLRADGSPPSGTVDVRIITKPPRLDYPIGETLLCRDDFI